MTTLSAPAETKASPEAVTASELSSADCEPSRMRMAEPSYASQYVIFRSDPVVSSWLSSGWYLRSRQSHRAILARVGAV